MDKNYHVKRIVKFLNDTKIYITIDEFLYILDKYINNTIKKKAIIPYLLYTHFNIIY